MRRRRGGCTGASLPRGWTAPRASTERTPCGEAGLALCVGVVVVGGLGVACGDELLEAWRFAMVERKAVLGDLRREAEPLPQELLRELDLHVVVAAELGEGAEGYDGAALLHLVVVPFVGGEGDVEAGAAAPLGLYAVALDFVAEGGQYFLCVAEAAVGLPDFVERVVVHLVGSLVGSSSEAISCMAVCLGRSSRTARPNAHASPMMWHSSFARVTAV